VLTAGDQWNRIVFSWFHNESVDDAKGTLSGSAFQIVVEASGTAWGQ